MMHNTKGKFARNVHDQYYKIRVEKSGGLGRL